MNAKGLLIVAATIGFALTAPRRAPGDVRRETPDRRPYIVEIGEPYGITMRAVSREAAHITALREYLSEYGYPDYAEVQEIRPEWPWESYEVRLYYIRRNLETDFGHVFVSAAMPHFGVMKFLGDITPEKRHEIEVILESRETQPPPAPAPAAVMAPAEPAPAPAVEQHEQSSGGLNETLVARIEAAADRAAVAADRAAESSEAAKQAADRAVAIVDQLLQNPPPARHRGTRH